MNMYSAWLASRRPAVICISALLLGGGIPAVADTRIVAAYTAEGQTTETTISARGERIRYDYGQNESLVRQCDSHRIVQIDGSAKTYQSSPETPEPERAPVKTETLDTGERKQIFGYEARRVKTVETAAEKKGRAETDGWYVTLTDLPSCYGAGPQGFPLAYKITSFGANGRPSSTVAMEVRDLKAVELDPALFEVPPGYKDVAARDAIKPRGVARVGLAAVHNRSNHKIATEVALGRLRARLEQAKFDVHLLEGGPAEAVRSKAGEADCDYVLYTELLSVEKPETGKVGGLLHRTPIVGRATDGDAFEAVVEYRLAPVRGPMPNALKVTAKTGHAVNWVGAAMLAANLTPMGLGMKALGGVGGLNPVMISALFQGGDMGSAMVGVDPMMGIVSMFVRGVDSTRASGKNPPGMDAAILAAVEQEGSAVLEQLKKEVQP